MNQKRTQRSAIRSRGLGKLNRITRAAGYLDDLLPAFKEWQAGEIYVCRKSGAFRYRFGARSKHLAPWDALARSLFESPAEFAFAAMVFVSPESRKKPRFQASTQTTPRASTRVNVLQLAGKEAA